MYRIMSESGTVAVTENVRFVKKSAAGSFIQAEKANATGVVADGTIYHLLNTNDIGDDYKTVWLVTIDGGGYIKQLETQLAATEDALCELDALINA